MYECTLVVSLNEHATFVVVCSFDLSKGNSVPGVGRRLTQLVQLAPQLVDTSASQNLLTCTKSNRGVCYAAQAGLTVTQLVLLNPQLVDNASKTCRVAAGQTLCRGAGLPSRGVETSRIIVCLPCCPLLGYISAHVTDSLPVAHAQRNLLSVACILAPGSCILAPASRLLHLRVCARSALHLQGLCVPGMSLTGGARTSEECDDSSVATRAAIAAAWTSTGQRAAIAGSAFVNALPGQEGISPAPSSIESPVCSVYICTALQGGHLCVRRVKVNYTMPEVLDLPDPRSILKPSSVVPLCRRVHRHGVRRQSQRHAVGVSQLPRPEPAHVRPAGRLRQCRLHRGRRRRAGAAQCPSLRKYRVFVSGCHDSRSWQGHLTGTPACRCQLIQLHSPFHSL